jgi:hypothetical protein
VQLVWVSVEHDDEEAVCRWIRRRSRVARFLARQQPRRPVVIEAPQGDPVAVLALAVLWIQR